MKQQIGSVAAGVLCLALAGPAGALSFDFRQGPFAPPTGVSHHSVAQAGFAFEFSALNVTSWHPEGTLWWDAADGFGIIGAGWEDDEVELPEALRLSFGELVFVESFSVSDLFVEDAGTRPERGFYSLDGGASWTSFGADGVDDNGEIVVPVAATASSVLFTSAGRDERARRNGHEFSLAGVDLHRDGAGDGGPAAPEPGAALLFAAGALWIGRRRARRT